MSIAHLSTLAAALLAELKTRSAAAGGTHFRAGHRALAEALGCSAGSIPRAMAELEAAELIDRQPYKNTRLIQLIDQQSPDRSLIDQVSAPLIDQQQAKPRRARQDAGKRQQPHHSPSCARASSDQEEEDPTLVVNPPPNPCAREQLVAQMLADKVHEDKTGAILAARPDLTLALWAAEVAGMKARGKGVGYLVRALCRGNTLVQAATSQDRAIAVEEQPYGDAYRRGSDLTGLDPQLLQRYFGGRHAP